MPAKAILKILNGEHAGEEFVFDFNPAKYTIETGNRFQVVNFPELSAPLLQFVTGEGETVSLEFLLDDTLKRSPKPLPPLNKRLAQLERALAVDPSLHAPPLVSFVWGQEILPQAVVEKLSKRFVLFSEEGLPVRVRLSDLEALSFSPRTERGLKPPIRGREQGPLAQGRRKHLSFGLQGIRRRFGLAPHCPGKPSPESFRSPPGHLAQTPPKEEPRCLRPVFTPPAFL